MMTVQFCAYEMYMLAETGGNMCVVSAMEARVKVWAQQQAGRQVALLLPRVCVRFRTKQKTLHQGSTVQTAVSTARPSQSVRRKYSSFL